MLMRQMRQNTKIIMLVTALTFVALMVFEWGMDMSGRSAGAGTLGRVGGTDVSVTDFNNVYRTLYDRYQDAQELPISTAQNRMIEDQAWEEIVNEILIRNEVARRNIRVTDDELRLAMLYDPHPSFLSDPSFRTETGQFDMTRYQQALAQGAQTPGYLQHLEAYYRDRVPRQKLMRSLSLGIFVPDSELWERWRMENEAVEASFIAVSPNDQVQDSEITIAPTDVEAYYEENQEDFALPARASVSYLFIDKSPTPADTAAARERVVALRQEIAGGGDFAEVAVRESGDEASAAQGGALGTVTRGALIPVLDSAAFSLPVGTLSQPLESPFGYHLIEVTSRTGDDAEVRHILVPLERTAESEIDLLTRADSLESLSIGRTLAETASQLGLTVSTGEVTEEIALLPGIGSALDAQDWIFIDRDGSEEVSPLFENESVFYLVEINELSPEGVRALEEVSSEIEGILRTERKTEALMERARGWAQELKSGLVTLEDLAERIGVPVSQTGRFTRMDFVTGLGQQSRAIGAAFGTAEGGTAGPIVAFDQVILLRVERKYEADRAAWEAQKDTQRGTVASELNEDRLAQWLEGLRESTRIVDAREEYFRAAEAQQEILSNTGGL